MTDDDGPPVDRESGTADGTGDGDREGGPGTIGDGPPSPDGPVDREELRTDRRTLDGRVRWKWCLRATIVAAVLGAIAGVLSVVGPGWGLLPGVGVFAFALVAGVGHALALYRTWEYRIREDALYLERGVFTHVRTVVPFVRVQHIDTSRGPIERAIGLSSLVVYTAGSRGADVTVPGLTPAIAEDLQERLKLLAKDSSGDDAV